MLSSLVFAGALGAFSLWLAMSPGCLPPSSEWTGVVARWVEQLRLAHPDTHAVLALDAALVLPLFLAVRWRDIPNNSDPDPSSDVHLVVLEKVTQVACVIAVTSTLLLLVWSDPTSLQGMLEMLLLVGALIVFACLAGLAEPTSRSRQVDAEVNADHLKAINSLLSCMPKGQWQVAATMVRLQVVGGVLGLVVVAVTLLLLQPDITMYSLGAFAFVAGWVVAFSASFMFTLRTVQIAWVRWHVYGRVSAVTGSPFTLHVALLWLALLGGYCISVGLAAGWLFIAFGVFSTGLGVVAAFHPTTHGLLRLRAVKLRTHPS